MMGTKLSQFLAVVLTALALMPGGAHLMALPAKVAMPEHPYFVVQQIYGGWAWAGVQVLGSRVRSRSPAPAARRRSA